MFKPWLSKRNIQLFLIDPAAVQAADDPMLIDSTVQAKIGIVQVVGTIRHRHHWYTVSLDDLRRTIDQFIQDDSVDGILLDIDSPGGEAAGVAEFTSWLGEMRSVKPIVTYVNELSASAAYWIASATSKIVAPPTARIGSIGVIALHADMSKMLQERGMIFSVFRKKSRKAEGSPFEPLTDAAKAGIQLEIDQMYDYFVDGVAQLRGMTASQVQDMAGESEVFYAEDALKRKMIDQVGNMDDAIETLTGMIGVQMDQAQLEQELADARSKLKDYDKLRSDLDTVLEREAKLEAELVRTNLAQSMEQIVADGKLPKTFVTEQFISWCSRLENDDMDFLLDAFNSLPNTFEIEESLDPEDAPPPPAEVDLVKLGEEIADINLSE